MCRWLLFVLLIGGLAAAAEEPPTFYVEAASGVAGTPHSYRQIGLFADRIACQDLIYGTPLPSQAEIPRAVVDRIVIELSGASLAQYHKDIAALIAAVPGLAEGKPTGPTVSLYYQGKSYLVEVDASGAKQAALAAIAGSFIPAKFALAR